jgi:hypothetical protein
MMSRSVLRCQGAVIAIPVSCNANDEGDGALGCTMGGLPCGSKEYRRLRALPECPWRGRCRRRASPHQVLAHDDFPGLLGVCQRPRAGSRGSPSGSAYGFPSIAAGGRVGRGEPSKSKTVRNPSWCQAMTVSGLTRHSADRQSSETPQNQAHRNRSNRLSFGLSTERCSTPSWWAEGDDFKLQCRPRSENRQHGREQCR